MDAESTQTISADPILAETQAESALHLLTALRRNIPRNVGTGLAPLDAHLSAVSAHPSRSPLGYGDVIEIQGAAASGKTQVLYQMMITCLLPSDFNSLSLGGWGKVAVILDTDGTFNARRLYQLLVSRIVRMAPSLEAAAQPYDMSTQATSPVELLASRCLANLHIFRPSSSLQLAACLLHLTKYHASEPSLQSQGIGMLAIDSISAFYWQDRFTLEQLRDRAVLASIPVSSTKPLGPPLQYVLEALRNFRQSYDAVVVYTNWGLHPLDRSLVDRPEFAYPIFKQHLRPFPSPFDGPYRYDAHARSSQRTTFPSQSVHVENTPFSRTVMPAATTGRSYNQPFTLTHHITLHPVPINPFPADYTLAQAKQGENLRSAAVKQGRTHALVRTVGQSIVGEFVFGIATYLERDALHLNSFEIVPAESSCLNPSWNAARRLKLEAYLSRSHDRSFGGVPRGTIMVTLRSRDRPTILMSHPA